MFTDGSYTCDQKNTGPGVSCELFSFYTSMNQYRSALDRELKAITIVLQQINCICDRFNNAVLFIDLKATILAILNQYIDMSKEIIECQTLYSHFLYS